MTIPGIVYVVDCGFVKMRWYNPNTQTDALVVLPISKASAQQRCLFFINKLMFFVELMLSLLLLQFFNEILLN